MEGRPADDGELFARAQRGDAAAYEEIVHRYQQVAFRTAYVITGSAADAEDAAQEGFVKAYRALATFRPGAEPRPWLALSLDNPIAFCIDLPGSGYASSQDGFHWSLALSADGSHLFAANGAMGVVADIDTGNDPPALTRTVQIDTTAQSASLFGQDVQAKEFGANGAVLSPDGRTLVMSGATGVVWVDTATLHARGRQLANWTVWSLALSPNGNNLYAVSDSGMLAEMSMAGTHLATVFPGGAGQPMALLRVEAAQVP